MDTDQLPIEVQTIRHPVGEDGTPRYRFTFHVAIDPRVATTAAPQELGRQFTDALLDALLHEVSMLRPTRDMRATRSVVPPDKPCPKGVHGIVCDCPDPEVGHGG